ncbi:MAG: hypothetical protein GY737_09555, partial [Desulfobacteraceae bacterium]|nr:hypothetical protein [Desulfobacteraceae bacterium]
MTISYSKGNDFIIPSVNDETYMGGAGDDTYVFSNATIGTAATITIMDTEGANKIQLIDGLEISSSIVYNNAAQLTLNNGAVLQILGASEFGYTVGGNILTGAQGTGKTYDTFVQENLGTTVPEGSTSSQGGEAVIGEEGGGGTVEPQYTSVSADIGEIENHGTLDALGKGFKFTDDPNVANFVDIRNFSTDDR